MSLKLQLIILTVCCLIAGAIGYKLAYSPPAQISQSQSQNNTDIVTIIKEVTSKSGEITKETVITDKSVVKQNATTVKLDIPPKYLVMAGYTSEKSYLVGAGYAVLKNVYLGAQYNTAGYVAATLTVTF